ncbi:hypothetical protein [Streptomyces sp. 135]|uniref:hypothetical protein n=1 Tax=Streptomyces sp. 135 TaxID=2838850 RepID=UPI001CBD3EBF|nr:hypothetical protein [Streptomyces sp. 135]
MVTGSSRSLPIYVYRGDISDFGPPPTRLVGTLMALPQKFSSCDPQRRPIRPFAKPNPAGNISLGDVAGWGGDLMTLYGEWRRDHDSYASGATYVNEKMGKIGVASTFGFTDLVEDADGYLIAEALRDGKTIVEAVRDHYRGSGGLTRFRDYLHQRFGGTKSEAAAQGKKILTDMSLSTDGTILQSGRAALIQKFGGIPTLMPHLLPDDQLNAWCNAFGNNLMQHANTETLRRSQYQANQRRLLGPK